MLMRTPRAPKHSALFHQRAVDRLASGFDHRIIAGTNGGAHHGVAHAGHDRPDIREVAVDQTRRVDDVGDALHRLPQHIVGKSE